MKVNLGIIDRFLRLLLVTGLAILFYNNDIHGIWYPALYIFAFIMLVTVILGFCPIYALFGLDTNEDHHHHASNS